MPQDNVIIVFLSLWIYFAVFKWLSINGSRPKTRGGRGIFLDMCGGSETPCNITRYYVMIVHCMISVLFSVYKLAYFGIQLTNAVSVFRLESSPVVTSFANFHSIRL